MKITAHALLAAVALVDQSTALPTSSSESTSVSVPKSTSSCSPKFSWKSSPKSSSSGAVVTSPSSISTSTSWTNSTSTSAVVSISTSVFKSSSTFTTKPSSSVTASSTSRTQPSAPPFPTSSLCIRPAVRLEWRSLSQAQKDNYISAVQCLTTKPSRLGLNTTLYDDFPYVHSKLNNDIHFVAQFLPWHRYFVHLYETALKTECGYLGVMPYWDWTLDSSDPANAPMWSPTTGFGGNGLYGSFSNPARPNMLTMCLQNGPFRNFTPAYFTGLVRPHCLNRGFNNNGPGPLANMGGDKYSPEVVANITNVSTTFETFATALENGPHGVVHTSVGGDMQPSTSPNDPIFFLHHTQIDMLWWKWQQLNSTGRDFMYGGNRYQQGTANQTAATLADLMPLAGFGPDLAVGKLMTTRSELLCYRY